MTRALEIAQSENVTLRKELKAQEELLHKRQSRRKEKRVALKGKFVLSTDEVLKITREAEADSARKKRRQRQRPRSASIRVSVMNLIRSKTHSAAQIQVVSWLRRVQWRER
jgi:hypothetical protein